jgi:S-adenosylmethionine-diacylglycerol 3-amino-3-carboxypropyl transferase
MTTQVPIGDGVRGVGLSTHETVDALEPPRLHDRLLGRYRTVPSERRHLYNGAILYTTSDEDSTSELWALRLGPGDAVLSITGSGCRTLALLAGDVRRVVSVDGNPLQNYLLELKMHAMQAMEREEFLEFVGVRATNDRLTRYATFRRSVSDQALRFWDSNPHIIARGVIFSGAHETYYRRILSPLILGVRREKVRRLFSFEDVSEQREFYQRDWNTRWWRLALRLALRPSVFRLGVRDPSYF